MTDQFPNATRILVNALEDPVAGINQLIRQGALSFPAATVTMIENMAKAGDTAGADAIIMKALGDSVGGMAQAAAQAPGARHYADAELALRAWHTDRTCTSSRSRCPCKSDHAHHCCNQQLGGGVSETCRGHSRRHRRISVFLSRLSLRSVL